MPILVRNIRLSLNEPESALVERLARQLKIPRSAVRSYAPVRRSLDARDHSDLHFVYHVEVALDDQTIEQRVVNRFPNRVALLHYTKPPEPILGNEPLPAQPVIVGFGPAGMFAALRFIQFGFKPIVLERGRDVRRRHRDILQKFYREREFNAESNLLFGEGGAGTYSDGKLYTRISDPFVPLVLRWLYDHGADPDILVNARPHIGSDRLPTICSRIRAGINNAGGQVRFDAQLQQIEIKDGSVREIVVSGERTRCGPLVIAIGHSARDTMSMLYGNGLTLEPRPFQLGVRIEHPQSLVDRWQYGRHCDSGRLPPAEYHVVAKGAAGHKSDCYSFCMCPGGVILPTHESAGLIATNGASNSRRGSPFANSGLVISIPPFDNDKPLAGLEFQKKWERKAYLATGGTYDVPVQRASDYLAGRVSDGEIETSYPLGGRWTDIRQVVPQSVADAVAKALAILDKRMPGFAGDDALVTAPETRASSPVRLTRDKELRTAAGLDNLYPVGEGAGYAGGIVSAAIDGIKSADAIIRRYRPD